MMTKEPDVPLDLETVARLAKQTTLAEGHHIPSLLVQGTEGIIMGQIGDMPSTHEARAQRLFETGFLMAQQTDLGLPIQAYFISEAWLSFPKKGELTVPPSQDPQRIEVLIIAGINLIAQTHSLLVLEMIREAGQLVALQEQARQTLNEKTVHSPLMEAFVAGYLAGQDDNAHTLPS